MDDVAHDPATLRRIERERAMLAEGDAQLARGEYLEEHELLSWLEQLETDPNAPLPLRPGRRS